LSCFVKNITQAVIFKIHPLCHAISRFKVIKIQECKERGKMATVTISSKRQVTILKGIRDHHTVGNEIKFLEGLEKTLSEWSEKNDEEAYENLKDT
jgi:phosphopantothenoylcysteine synthetase/decarboxylase